MIQVYILRFSKKYVVFKKFKNAHHYKFEFKKEHCAKQPNKQLEKSVSCGLETSSHRQPFFFPFLCSECISRAVSVNERVHMSAQ